MFKFDGSDVQRMGVAALGALILSVTAVGTAVGPARAVETAPAVYATAADADGVRA